MKKVFFILVVMMISLTSCDLFQDSLECSKNVDKSFSSQCTVHVYKSGEPYEGVMVSMRYTKYRCDGTQTNMADNPTTNSQGIVVSPNFSFNLNNNNDYVELFVECEGEYQTQTFEDSNVSDAYQYPVLYTFNF